jgi:hypothetical protein
MTGRGGLARFRRRRGSGRLGRRPQATHRMHVVPPSDFLNIEIGRFVRHSSQSMRRIVVLGAQVIVRLRRASCRWSAGVQISHQERRGPAPDAGGSASGDIRDAAARGTFRTIGT